MIAFPSALWEAHKMKNSLIVGCCANNTFLRRKGNEKVSTCIAFNHVADISMRNFAFTRNKQFDKKRGEFVDNRRGLLWQISYMCLQIVMSWYSYTCMHACSITYKMKSSKYSNEMKPDKSVYVQFYIIPTSWQIKKEGLNFQIFEKYVTQPSWNKNCPSGKWMPCMNVIAFDLQFVVLRFGHH